MTGPAASAEPATGGTVTGDNLSFWQYFSEFFVPENRLNIPLKREHEEICEQLEAAVLGLLPYRYICVTMPPRIGKTKTMEALAEWNIGYMPNAQIILTGYSHDMIKQSIAFVRQDLEEPWYVELFGPMLRLARDDHIGTTDGGNIYAEGVFGSILGKGAGLKEPGGGFIGIDDPAKPNEVPSPSVAKKLQMWFENPLSMRRNSDRWCPIIIISQRLGLLDLVEYLKRTYPEETLVLKFPCFVDGHSRFPETWSDDRYTALQKTRVGRFVLASVFQQDPVQLGGNLIPTDKFLRYAPGDKLLPFDEVIFTCDTAIKEGQENDYWVIQAWGRLEQRVYLLDQLRGQWTSPEFVRLSGQFWQKHNALRPNNPVSRFIIEEAGSGVGIIQGLNELGVPATGIVRIKDKAARVNDILPFVETGMVLIPRDDDPEAAEWLPEWLAELGAFSQDMSHEHDDQVDPFADAIHELVGTGVSILQALGLPDRISR